MITRKATINDLDVIVDFILEEAREAEGRTLHRATLEEGIGVALRDDSIAEYWLMEDQDEVACGSVSVVREWSDWNAGYYWWIQSIYIAPDYRGKGYIDIMLDAISKEARERNCLDIRLYVHNDNKAAMRAYEKAGFAYMPHRIMSRPA